MVSQKSLAVVAELAQQVSAQTPTPSHGRATLVNSIDSLSISTCLAACLFIEKEKINPIASGLKSWLYSLFVFC